MATKDKTFKIRDKVFAKVKGYRPWPAKITDIKIGRKTKYHVCFYGTQETASLTAENLFHYVKNKEAFTKNAKKITFLRGLIEIENDVRGTGANGDRPGEKEAGVIKDAVEGAGTHGDEPVNMEVDSNKDAVETDTQGDVPVDKESDISSTGSIPPTSASTSREITHICGSDQPQTKNETDQGSSKMEECLPGPSTSKSKKAKSEPKKIMKKLDDEAMRLIPQCELQAYIAYAQHMQNNQDAFRDEPLEDRDDRCVSVFVIELEDSNVKAVKFLGSDTPKFDLEYDRALYEAEVAKKLLKHKDDLLAGKMDVLRCLQLNSDVFQDNYIEDFDLNIHEVRQWLQSEKERAARVKTAWKASENRMLELDIEIRTKLSTKSIEAKKEARKALIHMCELRGVVVDDAMLLKHPTVMELVRRLRKYVGSVEDWNLTPEDLKEFQVIAQKIRDKAAAIIVKFRRLLKIPESSPYYADAYYNALSKFEQRASIMTDHEVAALTFKPYSRKFFIDKYLNQPSSADQAKI